jgi:hypothetical protein
MVKKLKSSDKDEVSRHIKGLEPALAKTVEALREIILSTDEMIGEHIKWNSPAFYYTGPMKEFDPKEYKRDIVVLNLHKGRILMVFPTGARISDSSGILEGTYSDGRRMIQIKDIADLEQKEEKLRSVIRKWLLLVEKD